MHKLKRVLEEQARAELDDRELRSRSDARRERHEEADALIALATRLRELTPRQLARVGLEPELLEVVQAAQQLPPSSALRRQLKVVRKVLRELDWEELRDRLEWCLAGGPAPARPKDERSLQADQWIGRLLEEGDSAQEAFLEAHSRAERQRLRQLVRQLRSADTQTPAARKKLEAYVAPLLNVTATDES